MRHVFLALVLLCAGASAQAAEPSVLAPFRFQPAPESLSPIEQQRALSYRSQVQGQLRQLEQHRITKAPLRAREAQQLQDTRGELQRLNGLVAP